MTANTEFPEACQVIYRCSKKCEAKTGHKVVKRVKVQYRRLTRPDRFNNQRTIGRRYLHPEHGYEVRYLPTIHCDHCNQSMSGNEVEGRFNQSVACDKRCTSAVGHKCECSCGGANHGADHND